MVRTVITQMERKALETLKVMIIFETLLTVMLLLETLLVVMLETLEEMETVEISFSVLFCSNFAVNYKY